MSSADSDNLHPHCAGTRHDLPDLPDLSDLPDLPDLSDLSDLSVKAAGHTFYNHVETESILQQFTNAT